MTLSTPVIGFPVSRTCGATTNVNNTYFTSPGYPAAYAGGPACSMIVNRCNANVCQVRLCYNNLYFGRPHHETANSTICQRHL